MDIIAEYIQTILRCVHKRLVLILSYQYQCHMFSYLTDFIKVVLFLQFK